MPESASAFSMVSFVTSAGPDGGLPPEDLPEIAFAGRSNVGKSSAINALAKRRRLAFVSKTPGRTQRTNFFDLAGRDRLVDLPVTYLFAFTDDIPQPATFTGTMLL